MLNDRKITDWTQPVSSLDDRPQMTASALKAAFDSNSNQLKPAVNGIIDDLTGTTGAGNIGVEAIAGVTGTTIQAMLAALKALIDLCDTEENVDDKLDLKADKTTTDKLVKTITLDADTGVFTIKTDDGTTTTIDTMLEKIPVNCYLDGQEFVLVLDDGTEQRADLSDFLTPTEFTDSSTIDFSVSGSTVTATIKNNSVTLQMLESTVISTIQGYVTAAQTAAGNASTSETNAGTYRDQAQTAATNSASSASESGAKATLSQSWAIGGTGTRQGEDTNNSKYFAQQSAGSASTAQGWSDSAMEQADAAASSASAAAGSAATASQAASNAANQVKTELQGYVSDAEDAAARAEQAAEDAEAIVGGDYIPNSQKGVAGGVATLDSSGKVPSGQLPEMNYIPTSQKGQPGGVATLGSDGKVPEGQLPSMDYIPTSQKGAASGVASLDATGKLEETQKPDYTASEVGAVPTTRTVNGKKLSADVTLTGDDIKTSASDNTHIGDVVSVLGGATTPQGALANLGAGVRPSLLVNGDFRAGHVVNQRNITSVSTAGNYLIDRWKLYASGTASLVSKGVHLQNVVDFGTQIELARLETGKTYTFSIYTADGKCGWVTHAFEGNVSESYVTVLGDTGITLNAIYNWNNGSTNLVAFQGTAVLSYAKVEEGDTQTLAYQDDTGAWQLLPQPESDYATQMLKCQRYYQIYSTADARPSKAVDCRPVMRTDPAQGTIVVGDTTYYYNTAEL